MYISLSKSFYMPSIFLGVVLLSLITFGLMPAASGEQLALNSTVDAAFGDGASNCDEGPPATTCVSDGLLCDSATEGKNCDAAKIACTCTAGRFGCTCG
ncbi:hypothetical protein Pan189_35030 [Stratiformator vulcanicus]|uniref:Uncharacterized protein n=1 Tax=Stratiformator vulcanicus TaxID=2527980 RepID=A0A517R5D8_9PLAN|nr:hypothetical protein Pan189_35030 [Stratiformator vulcanicus]